MIKCHDINVTLMKNQDDTMWPPHILPLCGHLYFKVSGKYGYLQFRLGVVICSFGTSVSSSRYNCWGDAPFKTSQELRMLSSVALNCQARKIVMKSGSQLSELWSVSQMWQVSGIVYVIVFVIVFVFVFVFCQIRSCPLITLIKCVKGHKSLRSLFEGVL